MGKLFFDVFPTLKTDGEARMLFQDASVEKVSTNSAKEYLRVEISCRHLIQKPDICRMERAIKEQLFARTPIAIRIQEGFFLSEQYTPENLYREYRESILWELRQRSQIEYSMLLNAKYTFENDNIMCLSLDDTVIAKGKKDEIVGYLCEIFTERCHVPVQVRVEYQKPKESKMKKFNEIQIQQEVAAIMQQNALRGSAKEETDSEGQKLYEAVRQAEKTESGKSSAGQKSGEAANAKKPEGKAAGKAGEAEPKKEFRKDFKKEFKRDYAPLKKSDDPSVIFGRSFEDESIELKEVTGEMGEIVFRGQVISFDTREIRNEKTIIMFAVTDFTDTIMVKMFARNEQLPELLAEIKKGAFLKIKGVTTIDKFDNELTIGSVTGIRKIQDFTVSRKDTAPEKRVELHCHTKMSDMDGVSEPQALVKRAHSWGHKAIAITDHGVVQAFPDANHFIEKLDKDDPFKVIYGVEGYLVDDLTEIAVNAKEETLDDTYVVFDIETTGFSSLQDKIIEIGAVKVVNGEIADHFSEFVNPGVPIPFKITQLTSITDEMVMNAPKIDVILPKFLEFAKGAVLVAHNAGFDVGFIEQNCKRQGLPAEFVYVDTVALARVLMPTLSKYKLDHVAKALNISLLNHHRAVDDAGATAEIFVKFVTMLKERNIMTLEGVNEFGHLNPNAIRKLPTYHVIILAKNDTGRVNLYRLISMSHLTYYGRRPRIPKSELNRCREGLIVGSACEAGELYRALLDNKSAEKIAEIVSFYDYLEVQPVGNNKFMIESDKIPNIQSIEDIQNMNRRIVKLGEEFEKPVVATCDVHFMDPDDEVYRRIIMAGKGFTDADEQAAALFAHDRRDAGRICLSWLGQGI